MIIIAEKINGSIPSVAKAIAERDEEHLKSLAIRQAEQIGEAEGFIDVCSSVAPEVEFETMRWMLDLVQGVTDVPISVDSPNAECLLELLPYVKKPGLVNSVSGEGDKTAIEMKNLEYSGSPTALTLIKIGSQWYVDISN